VRPWAVSILRARGREVQLTWSEFKSTKADSALVSDFNKLQRIFALTGYQPVLLLDATAQLELAHHLDDEHQPHAHAGKSALKM
jgi:hypothetical protein